MSETAEYKYVGLWVNKQGNCCLQIERKSQKMKGEVVGLKSIANYYNVGETFVNVRLELHESCLIPSLLYNLEGWNKLTKAEIKKLEQTQAMILCSLLGIPKTTPYIGLLNEVGMWRIEERIMYRKIMLYHNIYNSPRSRLVKRIIDEQMEEEEEDTFYSNVKEMAMKLDLQMETIGGLTKSRLKVLVKKKIEDRMVKIIKESENMTKLRFVDCCEELTRKEYIRKMKGSEAIKALKTRLNMIPIYGNYKGDVTLPRLCSHCNQEEDTTEHLVSCEVFSNDLINPSHLRDEKNVERWRMINELVDSNMSCRS